MDDDQQNDRIKRLEDRVDQLEYVLDQALMILGDSDNLGIDAVHIENLREETD